MYCRSYQFALVAASVDEDRFAPKNRCCLFDGLGTECVTMGGAE